MQRRYINYHQYREDLQKAFYPAKDLQIVLCPEGILCKENFQQIFFVEKSFGRFFTQRRSPENIQLEKGLQNVFFVQETFRRSSLQRKSSEAVFSASRKFPWELLCLQKIVCVQKISKKCSKKRTIRKGLQKVFYVENTFGRALTQKRPLDILCRKYLLLCRENQIFKQKIPTEGLFCREEL